MIQRSLRFAAVRRIAWFLADHSIMRETLEEAFKRRLLSARQVSAPEGPSEDAVQASSTAA